MDTVQPDQPMVTQINFEETPYFDASWEIVGEPPKDQQFTPLSLQVIPQAAVLSDPMFADYGGSEEASKIERWHLPAELSAAQSAANEAPAEDPNLIKISPEELEAIKTQAREEGHAAALAQAQSEAQSKLVAVGEQLQIVIDDLKTQIQENFGAIEKAAVKLSVDISHKLLGHAVEINPEYIVNVVNQALNAAGGAPVQKVRVSPSDMEFIEIVGLGDRVRGKDGSWDFVKDETVKSGCILETASGEMDFNLESAWERIRDQVMKAIG